MGIPRTLTPAVSFHGVCLRGMVVSMLALLAITMPGAAVADTVLMKDGRKIEGMIVSQDEAVVVIDTMISGIRAVDLRLQKSEVQEITTGPVDDDFYSTEVAPPPRSANAVIKQDHAGLYLVVPIKGELGTETVAGGVTRALAYAKRYRVPHVVFDVDSPGGNLDEILLITRSMRGSQGAIQFHAVLERCQGAALAIPLMCDTLHIRSGAVVGDTAEVLGEGSKKYGYEDDQVLRTELARRAFRYAVSKGSSGEIVRAMLDPLESLAAWTRPDGQIGMAMSLPEDVPAESVIFTTRSGNMLVLDDGQMTRLGIPMLDGSIADLGQALGIEGWQKESDSGETTMDEGVRQSREQQASKDTQFQRQLQSNILKRETTHTSIENNIQQAMQWDPNEGDYATYAKRYRWGGVGRRNRDYGYASGNVYTRESRNEWQRRSDLTMVYLREAAKACRSMKRLDAEAVKLGLEPTFKEGELETMVQDMDVKFRFVSDQRNKRGT